MREVDTTVLIVAIAVVIVCLGLFVGLSRLDGLNAEVARTCIEQGHIWADGSCLLP